MCSVSVGLTVVVISVFFLFSTDSTLVSPPEKQANHDTQAILNDNVDITMNQKPGGRPTITGSSNNMLWQSSDNTTALYLHTNSSGGGWGGFLELKRPGGGGTLGIKQPSGGGMPVVSMSGSTTIYESNGTSVGVNGMIDTEGNREGHMSIKRP